MPESLVGGRRLVEHCPAQALAAITGWALSLLHADMPTQCFELRPGPWMKKRGCLVGYSEGEVLSEEGPAAAASQPTS